MRLEKPAPGQEGPAAPYDAIYSIGAHCGCAMWLRKCGLRLTSGPLDWVRGESGLLRRVALIESRFAGWLEEKNLVLLEENARMRFYRDTALGVEFLHDFPTQIAFSDALRAAQTRYRRRQERFFQTIRAASRTLLVWFNTKPSLSEAELREAFRRLRACLGPNVELLAIEHAPDLPPDETRCDTPSPGVWFFRLNLRTEEPSPNLIVLGNAPQAVQRLFAPFRLRPDLARQIRRFERRQWWMRKLRKILAGFVPNRALRRQIRARDRAWE